jgi:glycerophosphoryl diester phosphodiesterase
LVFAPLMALAGQVLRGGTVLDSTALVKFFLSPRGLAATFIAAISFLLIRIMEQAGLSVLRAEEFGGASYTPATALKFVLSRFIPLLRAAARFIVLVVGMLVPFLMATGVAARHFLSRHDINFYLAQRPSDFIFGAAVVGVIAFITLTVIVWNMIRWRWVVHTILFEKATVGAAFERSAQLSKENKLKIALQWGAIGVLNVALGIVAAWLGRLLLPLGVSLLGQSIRSLGVLMGCLLVFQAVIGSLVLMAGPIVEAMIFTRGYFERAGWKLSGRPDESVLPSKNSKRILSPAYPVIVLVLVSIGGVAGGVWGTEALLQERPVKVIAHRGDMINFPENSLPAFQQSIADGADVIETDVQLSKDGVVVVCHDSDFSRMGGLAKKVSDLTWKEIQKVDIGLGMGENFRGVRVARLEDLLTLARGRIHLNIETKHYGPIDGKLEEKVVELIRRLGAIDETEIQSLEYESILAVRRLEPALKIGYLMSVNARDIGELKVDFLSVQASRVNAKFLKRAHKAGKNVYAWTVDKTDEMDRMMDLGVDGIITNQARSASHVLLDRRALSSREKAVRRIQTWLAS